jgi:hypothetical protein
MMRGKPIHANECNDLATVRNHYPIAGQDLNKRFAKFRLRELRGSIFLYRLSGKKKINACGM